MVGETNRNSDVNRRILNLYKKIPSLSIMAVDWKAIQTKWQRKWAEKELGKASVHKNKEKFMMIFAYPGISGYLHVGHMRGFTYTDTICRFERMQGKEVLFPVGTHASGNLTIAFANKVKNNDEKWMEYLRANGCPEEQLVKLTTPEEVIRYFNQVYVQDYWKKFGFLCDWDRFTSTSWPDYEKFIQWQFKKLQQKDLLVQKPYFATACVNCGPVAVDPSETDISKGGNAEKQEYTLLKLKFGTSFLVAATLRPETIYGQTNVWLNPASRYVCVAVDSESWIMSYEAAQKLAYQKDKILGKKVIAPGVNKEIMVFPAAFVDPAVGTGIVTCVPSHAPMDWMALQDLKNDKVLCDKWGIDIHDVWDTAPISIISVSGFGDHPAGEICAREKIETQYDTEKLEVSKKELYKTEFHTGVMKENCGVYAGKRVEEAKELVKAELLMSKSADVFHDLSEEVICRCGGKVVIKRIDDQWFIRYSDPELTERSKEQAREMKILPKEYYDNLPATLDWFSDRACARLGNWIGSKLPFDSKWTVEPISDSTLYPVYYIVSKFVNNGTLNVDDLTDEFFDFVFLGHGYGKEKWKTVREEFNYFYPLDFNLGGKEHKTVHFPVFIMNHVAILSEDKWPRGIIVNWWVTGKGSKISKSKGGAEPIPDAINKYGVDAMRLYYGHIGSPHVDVVWDEAVVLNYKNALERIYALAGDLNGFDGKQKAVDHWILSRMYYHLKLANDAMKEYNVRELASTVYFSMYDDLRWYVRRGGEHKKTIQEVLSIWARMMCPLTPHLAEEMYEGSELASTAKWPEFSTNKINLRAEAFEDLVKETIEGMRNVLKLAKVEKPKKYILFIAQSWLYGLFTLVKAELTGTHNVGEIMRKVLEQEAFQGHDVSKIVLSLVKDQAKIPALVTSQEEEFHAVREALEFLSSEFDCLVEVVRAEESDNLKAKNATPGKVGIIVE